MRHLERSVSYLLLITSACGDVGSIADPSDGRLLQIGGPDWQAIQIGDSAQFRALWFDVDGNILGPATVTWSSSNPDVATIDSSGLVVGRGPGEIEIFGAANQTSDSRALRITHRVDSIGVPDSLVLLPGNVITLNPMLYSAAADTIGRWMYPMMWSTSNSTVVAVTVDSLGWGPLLTAGAAGTATITIRVKDAVAVFDIRVGPLQFVDLAISDFDFPFLLQGGVRIGSCALTDNGFAVCWGTPDAYLPETRPDISPLTSIVGGADHVCGLTARSEPYCFGPAVTLGTGGDSVGLVLGGHTFASLAVGGGFDTTGWRGATSHTCGLAASGIAFCWGSDVRGQLGSDNGPCLAFGLSFPCAQRPMPVAGGLRFVAIAAGRQRSCGLSESGSTYCWGAIDDTLSFEEPTAIAADPGFASIWGGQDFMCGVTGSGEAYCWGSRLTHDAVMAVNVTAPVRVLVGVTVTSLSLGRQHSCALDIAGTAYCWGSNGLGQLGRPPHIGVHQPAPAQTALRFTKLAVGWGHTCGLATDGILYCWGNNTALGRGVAADQPDWQPQPITGQALP